MSTQKIDAEEGLLLLAKYGEPSLHRSQLFANWRVSLPISGPLEGAKLTLQGEGNTPTEAISQCARRLNTAINEINKQGATALMGGEKA